jgi:hypothetical protein
VRLRRHHRWPALSPAQAKLATLASAAAALTLGSGALFYHWKLRGGAVRAERCEAARTEPFKRENGSG